MIPSKKLAGFSSKKTSGTCGDDLVHEAGALPPHRGSAGAASSDRSLLQRFRQGSQDAATQLYLRYAQRLHALTQAQCSEKLARQVDAEEIVQSVFGSFFRGASQGYYDVPASEDLWKLFLVIALNKIRAKGNYFRAAKRDVRLTMHGKGIEDQAVDRRSNSEKDMAFLQVTVDEALDRLPPRYRQMVTLRIEGYEVAEIAKQTGRSQRTVERILQQARQRLTEYFQGE
jgi:RNA polymerase sigma-70 factor (ECF subfamily)